MRNTQIAICCALALNLVLIMLVATGTWEFKYKRGDDVGNDNGCGNSAICGSSGSSRTTTGMKYLQ